MYEKYPKVKPELIDELIEIYFKEMKQAMKNVEKPEIAVLWGTLRLHLRQVTKEINTINVYLKNRDTPLNKVSDEKLQEKEILKEKLLKVLEQHKKMWKEGKIERKQKRLKLKNETKSDQP